MAHTGARLGLTLMIVAKVTVKTKMIDLSVSLGGSTVNCIDVDASLAYFKLLVEVLALLGELDMDFVIEFCGRIRIEGLDVGTQVPLAV